MELLTQAQVIEELLKYSSLEITQSSFSKRVKKGQIKFPFSHDATPKRFKKTGGFDG